MSDKPRAPQMQQVWNRPQPAQQQPAPKPALSAPLLTKAGPLRDTDTIAVTRGGVTVPVPLKVLAAYVAKAVATLKAERG